jgi:4-oxalocrotonate tautomerase
MPIIHATILEGRTQEQKEAFFKGVTEVAMATLNVPAEAVKIALHEVPKAHFSSGGISKAAAEANAS